LRIQLATSPSTKPLALLSKSCPRPNGRVRGVADDHAVRHIEARLRVFAGHAVIILNGRSTAHAKPAGLQITGQHVCRSLKVSVCVGDEQDTGRPKSLFDSDLKCLVRRVCDSWRVLSHILELRVWLEEISLARLGLSEDASVRRDDPVERISNLRVEISAKTGGIQPVRQAKHNYRIVLHVRFRN
jgi:hypothetical protein